MTGHTGRSARGRWAIALIAAVVPLGACLATALPAHAAAQAWNPEPVPVAPADLQAVAGINSHTAWAVGAQVTPQGKSSPRTPLLIARDDRDGRGWRRIPTPADHVADARFNAVSAASSQDVWVTGDADGAGIVTEHWDGATWQDLRAPVPANNGAGLLGVATVTPTDAWAVGWATAADESGDFTGLLDHWDGTAWNALPLPDGTAIAVLNAVTAVSAQDVWAVGFDTADQPVLLHYDGATWKQIPKPPIDGLSGELNAVTADGPNDVWAVGRVVTTATDRGHALALYWNGCKWLQAKAPAKAGPLSAASIAPGGLLAVGQNTAQDQGIAVQWNDDTVRVQTLPSPVDGAPAQPTAVEVGGGAATVVGSAGNPGAPTPLLLTGLL